MVNQNIRLLKSYNVLWYDLPTRFFSIAWQILENVISILGKNEFYFFTVCIKIGTTAPLIKTLREHKGEASQRKITKKHVSIEENQTSDVRKHLGLVNSVVFGVHKKPPCSWEQGARNNIYEPDVSGESLRFSLLPQLKGTISIRTSARTPFRDARVSKALKDFHLLFQSFPFLLFFSRTLNWPMKTYSGLNN